MYTKIRYFFSSDLLQYYQYCIDEEKIMLYKVGLQNQVQTNNLFENYVFNKYLHFMFPQSLDF